MAFARGFSQVKKAKEEAEKRQASLAAMRTREVYLREDGEAVTLWFNGPSDEPVEAYYHTLKLPPRQGGSKERFSFDLCASGAKGHEGCVFCWALQNGDKRVGRRSRNFVFNVVDTRFVHKTKNEDRSRNSQYEVFDWFDCPVEGDEPDGTECKLCKKKMLRTARGQSRLRLSTTVAGNLGGMDDTLQKKCVNCGGRVKTTGYVNGKKVLPDIDDVENPEDWERQYECSKCESPTPGNIHLCAVTMRRSGTGKTVSYNFSTGPFEDPPEWVQKIEPIDLEEALVPRTADQMAEMLGVNNPFEPWAKNGAAPKSLVSKSGAVSYDDDD